MLSSKYHFFKKKKKVQNIRTFSRIQKLLIEIITHLFTALLTLHGDCYFLEYLFKKKKNWEIFVETGTIDVGQANHKEINSNVAHCSLRKKPTLPIVNGLWVLTFAFWWTWLCIRDIGGWEKSLNPKNRTELDLKK